MFAAVGLALLPGCVTRKLHLRSDPPGAVAYLDGERVGVTPLELDFLSYGTRRVELLLPDHARHVELITLERPWWQWVPFDIVTELLLPWNIHSEHSFDIRLRLIDEEGSWEAARAAFERLRLAREALDRPVFNESDGVDAEVAEEDIAPEGGGQSGTQDGDS
ncbi:MAG: PEGA domain-containing protein [Planctomycetota bacterium]